MDINIALGIAGAVACLALSGLGSAIGTGFAAAGAIGAWKKCYAQNRPAPFLLLAYVGAPITQTLYGMILMFTMIATITGTFTAESIAALEPERLALLKGLGMTIAENAPSALPFAGMGMLILGIFAGASPTTSPPSVSLRPRPSSSWSSPSSPSATSPPKAPTLSRLLAVLRFLPKGGFFVVVCRSFESSQGNFLAQTIESPLPDHYRGRPWTTIGSRYGPL